MTSTPDDSHARDLACARHDVVGILLAAGQSSRFGSQKLLARMPDGKTLIEATLGQWQPALARIVVVTRRDAAMLDALQPLCAATCNLTFVINDSAADGMSASIASGVAVSLDARAWLIGLADMPWIATATLQRVAAECDEARICVPTFHGQRGHPVAFGSRYRDALLSLSGDTGARSIIESNSQQVDEVETTDAAILRDVDTPADLA
jgi:molybdenum cofactor cytidylyltransferase